MTASDGFLKGRTVAMVRLDAADLLIVSSAVTQAGGEWEAFGNAVDPARLRTSVACVCTPEIAEALGDRSPVPVLVIGDAVASADDFILPPPRIEEVTLRLRRLIEAQVPRARDVESTPVVLAADDDPTTTAIVRAVVTQNAMVCHTARDGREAFERAKELAPNVIVLDVNMPYRDGFEVLSALREEPRTAAIPVLMLTSLQQEADVMKGFRLGADDYVVKPFNPMELLARIKRLVRRR